jgi:hypothetical protein
VSPRPWGATVQWTTSVAANCRIEYGTTPSFGAVATNPTLVTSHSMQLKGLARKTTYYARVTSRAADGATVSSSTFTFKTK